MCFVVTSEAGSVEVKEYGDAACLVEALALVGEPRVTLACHARHMVTLASGERVSVAARVQLLTISQAARQSQARG